MKKIILLIDPPRKIEYADISRHDMEGYTPLEIELTQKAIEEFTSCLIYTDINKLMRRLWLHRKDLILPMYWGRGNRNAKALFPAICEARGISYIGADCYTQTLCNDKFLAKKYAKAFQFKTPVGFLLRNTQSSEEIDRIVRSLKLPLVIKPNFGGGSCGISDNNLVDSYESAKTVIQRLFLNQYNPLLVEEYIKGNELSVLLLGNHTCVDYCGETQLVLNGETFFHHEIWGFETKKINFLQSHYRVSNLLPLNELQKAKDLFLSLPKVEYLRVDGRLNERGFYVLELSADCYLGPNSDFSIFFESMGKTHSDFLHYLAQNALST